MNYLEIEKVIGREILDSRGNPTVEAEVTLMDVQLQEAVHRVVLQQASSRHWNLGTVIRKDILAKVYRRP